MSQNTHPTQRILQTIKAVEDEHQQWRETPVVSLLVEELGVLIGVIRRQKKYSRDKLAVQMGISPEVLFALEAGILHPIQCCEVLPSVLEVLGIPSQKLVEILRK
ncbi:MAG: helix-turn-helix transcriptional regulator [Anaerolineae bacterium]|nr:helix-turn-helix transcriptional regulator [Anaerolineae bacterium]